MLKSLHQKSHPLSSRRGTALREKRGDIVLVVVVVVVVVVVDVVCCLLLIVCC